jgi:ATP-binding cassette subfamily C protein
MFNLKQKFQFLIKLSELFDCKEKQQLLGITVAAFFTAIFQALGIASVLPFISLVMNPDIIFENEKIYFFYNFFRFQSKESFIVSVGFLMLGIILVGNLISAFTIWLRTRFIWQKNHSLSTVLLKRYLSLPYSFFLIKHTTELSKNVLVEVQNLTQSFLMPISKILIDTMITIFIFSTLIMVSPMATLAILTTCFIFYLVFFKSGFRKKVKEKGALRFKENQGRFKTASEALCGIKDIKLLGREDFFIDKFAQHSFKFSKLQSWNTVASQIPRYFIEIITFGGAICIILFLMLIGKNIQNVIPVVSFFAFAGYRLMPTVNQMFQSFAELQFNRAVLDKIYNDLIGGNKIDPVIDIGVKDGDVLNFKKEILLKDLSFSYLNAKKYVFKNINLRIQKDTSIAIVGPTGSGKTTLVDILLGLLTPSEGSMDVDGVKVTRTNLRAWQKNLGYVPQFIYLSDDSIKHNIAFGLADEAIDMKRVEQAAKIANLHDFIVSELPKGYETVIGERGIRLSGGQRQRVGIARALYHDPEVLVFDEATSSLDGATEDAVLRAVDNIANTKTIIMIAHRLTTVKSCDKIYLLDQGKILEQGTYQELIRNNP